MKSFLLMLLLVACGSFCLAQQATTSIIKYVTVQQDTINLHGIVYNAFGQPASNVRLISRNLDTAGTYLSTLTNIQGRFQLNGAKFNDTLAIIIPHTILHEMNAGSRYIEIYLPAVAHVPILSRFSVTAQRKVPRKPPFIFKYKKVQINAFVCDFTLILPEPIGGMNKFQNYVQSQLVYPQRAIDHNIEGNAEIGFTVNSNGLLTNFKVIRGIGYDCDEQVIHVLRQSPSWYFGKFMGKAYQETYSITVNFKLIDK